MLFLYRFICGYLEIVFYGEYREKILNLCAKNRITLWNSKYKSGKIFTKITVGDFLKLPNLIKNTGIRCHIIKRHGMPFFVKRYKKRIGMVVGIFLFLSVLYFLSQHIWIIEVTGNKKLSESEILKYCYSMGIKGGIHVNKINPKIMAQELLLKTDKLSWASFNIEGSKLVVNVSETKKNNSSYNPTNLKSTADGVISHLDVTSGNCVVKLGDTVKKGDLLVSGIIEGANGTKFVESKGLVVAETEFEITVSEDFKQEIYFKTGKKKVKNVISFFEIKIPLYLGKEKGDFSTELNVKQLKMFGKKLPIVIYSKKFTFLEPQEVTYNKKQLENLLKKQLNEKIKNQNLKDFQIKNTEILVSKEKMQLKAQILAKKDITKSENLIINIGK